MGTEISITAVSKSGWININIDGKLKLKKPGKIKVTLQSGHHYLTYFVQGSKGDAYTVSIDKPIDNKWKVEGKLTSDHLTGQYGFTT